MEEVSDRWPPLPGTPVRKALAESVFQQVKSGEFTYREIATKHRLSSTSIVTRLYREAIKAGWTEETREEELSRLAAWHERLEESFESALAAQDHAAIPGLAKAAAEISRELRKIYNIDVTPTLKLQNVGGGLDAPPPDPAVGRWAQRYKDSDLYAKGSNGDPAPEH